MPDNDYQNVVWKIVAIFTCQISAASRLHEIYR